MKIFHKFVLACFVIGALAIAMPVSAQLSNSNRSGGLTLKDLKKQNEDKNQGTPSQSTPSQGQNSGKSGGLNSLRKLNPNYGIDENKPDDGSADDNGGNSGGYSGGYGGNDKEPKLSQKEKDRICYEFMTRFRPCRDHDRNYKPSSHDNKPFAVMYYPMKNIEYYAITGKMWTMGKKYDYMHYDAMKAKEVINTIAKETGGTVKLRIAGTQELNYGKTYGAVEVAAPADGIYFDIPIDLYERLEEVLPQLAP